MTQEFALALAGHPLRKLKHIREIWKSDAQLFSNFLEHEIYTDVHPIESPNLSTIEKMKSNLDLVNECDV